MKGVVGFYIILSFFLFLRGLWNLTRAQSRLKERRKIEDTPISTASSAAAGYVELEGFAWPKTPPVITISGQTAVYQEFQLEKIVGSGKHRRWKTVYSKKTSESFYLLDGTGLIEVVPTGSVPALIENGTADWTSLDQATQDRMLTKIVTENVVGFPPKKLIFGMMTDSFRVSERRIMVGSPLYVRGSLQRESGPALVADKSLSIFASHALNFETGKLRNLKGHFDRNRDGKVSRIEAANGFHALAKSASQNKIPADGSDPEPLHCFGIIEKKNQDLVIADCHQKLYLESVSGGNARGLFWGSVQLSFGVLMIFAMFFPHFGVLLVQEAVEYVRNGPNRNPTEQDRIAEKLTLRKQIRSPKDCKGHPEICHEIGRDFLNRKNFNPQAALAYFDSACNLGHEDACRSIAHGAGELKISRDRARGYLWIGCNAGQPLSCEDWFKMATSEEKPAAFQKLKTLAGNTQGALAIRDMLPVDNGLKLELFASACVHDSGKVCLEMRRKFINAQSPSDSELIMSVPETFRRIQVPRAACESDLKRVRQARLTASNVDGECDGFIISEFWGESYGFENDAYLTLARPEKMDCGHKKVGSLIQKFCEEPNPVDLVLIANSKRTILTLGTEIAKQDELIKLKGSSDRWPLNDTRNPKGTEACPHEGSVSPADFERSKLGANLLVSNELLRAFKVNDPAVGQGFQLPYLRENSPLKKLGFAAGDVIFGVNGIRILYPDDLFRISASLINGSQTCVRWKKPTGAILQHDFNSE